MWGFACCPRCVKGHRRRILPIVAVAMGTRLAVVVWRAVGLLAAGDEGHGLGPASSRAEIEPDARLNPHLDCANELVLEGGGLVRCRTRPAPVASRLRRRVRGEYLRGASFDGVRRGDGRVGTARRNTLSFGWESKKIVKKKRRGIPKMCPAPRHATSKTKTVKKSFPLLSFCGAGATPLCRLPPAPSSVLCRRARPPTCMPMGPGAAQRPPCGGA